MTICVECEHCIFDSEKTWPRCAASAEEIPERVNPVTGDVVPEITYYSLCINLNAGDCKNFRRKTKTEEKSLLRKMLDKLSFFSLINTGG